MNNERNELEKYAWEKIKRDSKFKPNCCFISPINGIGATGPTGPAGPATIAVGLTTTSAPGTDATVTNVGTSENVILEFSIPEGDIGPTGATGATGPQGLQGIQGEIGPTGPIGPTAAHDYFFNKINRNYSFSKKYTPHKTVVYIFLFCFYNFF